RRLPRGAAHRRGCRAADHLPRAQGVHRAAHVRTAGVGTAGGVAMTPAARQLVVTLGMRHSTGQARLTMATVELRAAFARLMALAWALGRLEHAEEVTPHKSADALRCGPRGAGFEGRPEGMSMAKKRRTNRYGKGTVEWIAGCW